MAHVIDTMRSSQPLRYPEQGFTLIELAVVLVIIALIGGGLLNAWANQLVQQRINFTKANAETIKTALVNFISRNNRLPCPAIAGLLPSNPPTAKRPPPQAPVPVLRQSASHRTRPYAALCRGSHWA